MIERTSVRTQFLIFTLFGDYILPRGGTVWTFSLLSMLERLGVSERAARVTLSRMARKGWLTRQKEGRRARYSLTPRGWALLKQGEQRIFEPPLDNWDGLWHIVVYSLPEKKRHLRRLLRQWLVWLGFGQLTFNTWISPHNRKAEVKNVCSELDVQKYVATFSAMHVGPTRDQDLVQRCWDLTKLESRYQEFIKRFEPEYQACQANGGLSPETCFVRRFWLTHSFQSFPRDDPNLPTVLLPPDWIGFRARQLFETYRRLLEAPSDRFVDEVLNRDGAAASVERSRSPSAV